MFARVKYYDDYKGKEGYAIEICTRQSDDWGLDSFYPLVRREGASDEDGKNFIHFSIINKLAQLQELGYNISIW